MGTKIGTAVLSELNPTFALVMQGFSPQKRAVLDALGKAGRPLEARQVAFEARLAVNTASAVLGRLCASGWVVSCPVHGHRNVYEIARNHFWFKAWLRSRDELAGPAKGKKKKK